MALEEYQVLVKDMVGDQDDVITTEVRDRALDEARIRYSADAPRLELADIVWPATGVFGPVPDGWTDSSVIQSVEFPVGKRPASMVFAETYRTATGWGLESEQALPGNALVRVCYQLPHVLDATADSIPQRHRLPVASFAAHLLCQQLATRFAGDRETTLGSDMSRTESRSRNYAARAKDYRAAYFAGIGQLDPALQDAVAGSAASAVTSWPRRNPRHRLVSRGGL
ncbi:hypothetical protein N5D77_06045 [Comamonas thiooxydans]|uniref:Uncharacterized protein n=1 Tax=Comamonas thiooxydans TaxID=363952 RepID=A0AA42PZV0_9BURK|nr:MULTISPECIES: hypothetical protein [Comamonas]MDH1333261.1 hypothetical protein [Comamonas thiooxydans]MDH1738966.1 hypothetical protein [Comamonas thiooxydans]MDH1786131.1 hypothetical protein [Comamonas thiooxydans]MPS94983.1 hypothetical protein [Comamonas sp.]